jgi:RNA polymerase sigma factor (sigma-70 family)
MDHENPRRWRARLRAGDADAFAALFRTCVDRVHRVAARVCGDATQAEDVTAETFLVAWRQRATIADTTDDLLPWLLAIATRQALNAVRGRRRQGLFVARHGHRFTGAAPDIADRVAARLDDAERLERTRTALARLGAKELEVVVLCVWEEVGAREAAEALGVAEGTVRSRLSRARARLRELTEAPPDAPPERHPGAARPALGGAR